MADCSPGSAGSANTGNGGDGGGNPNPGNSGGSGIVVVKELSKASGVWSMQSQYQLQSEGTWAGVVPNFICASGGTITESGDYRIHTFTASGNLVVCTAPTPGNNVVSYMIVAGGGAGGKGHGGGGGAGGFREFKSPTDSYTASPLDGNPGGSSATVTAFTSFPVTIGAGGAGSPDSGCGTPFANSSGSNSVFACITSAGGGKAAGWTNAGATGGSGGGGGANYTKGANGGSGIVIIRYKYK